MLNSRASTDSLFQIFTWVHTPWEAYSFPPKDRHVDWIFKMDRFSTLALFFRVAEPECRSILQLQTVSCVSVALQRVLLLRQKAEWHTSQASLCTHALHTLVCTLHFSLTHITLLHANPFLLRAMGIYGFNIKLQGYIWWITSAATPSSRPASIVSSSWLLRRDGLRVCPSCVCVCVLVVDVPYAQHCGSEGRDYEGGNWEAVRYSRRLWSSV